MCIQLKNLEKVSIFLKLHLLEADFKFSYSEGIERYSRHHKWDSCRQSQKPSTRQKLMPQDWIAQAGIKTLLLLWSKVKVLVSSTLKLCSWHLPKISNPKQKLARAETPFLQPSKPILTYKQYINNGKNQ